MPSSRALPSEVQEIIDRHDIELVEAFRDGPRYYAALVKIGGEEAILKVVLPAHTSRVNPQNVAELSNLVRREIRLLRSFEQHRDQLAGRSPQLLDCGTGDPAWYIREHVPGSSFSHPEAPFVYGSDFFRAVPAAQVVDYVTSVHGISRLDRALVDSFDDTRFDLWDYERLSNWREIAAAVPSLVPLAPAIASWFDGARVDYDFATTDYDQAVVSHNEPYADHFFLVEGKLCLIDWENVGVSNRFRDFVSIWLRAFQNPTWQGELRAAIKAAGYLDGAGDKVWRTEIIMQSVANMGYFWRETFADKAYQAAANAFLLESIEAVLHDKAI